MAAMAPPPIYRRRRSALSDDSASGEPPAGEPAAPPPSTHSSGAPTPLLPPPAGEPAAPPPSTHSSGAPTPLLQLFEARDRLRARLSGTPGRRRVRLSGTPGQRRGRLPYRPPPADEPSWSDVGGTGFSWTRAQLRQILLEPVDLFKSLRGSSPGFLFGDGSGATASLPTLPLDDDAALTMESLVRDDDAALRIARLFLDGGPYSIPGQCPVMEVEEGELVPARAEKWSEDDICDFSELLWKKKIDEAVLTKEHNIDIMDEQSEMDSDDEKFFAFRSRWMAKWSDKHLPYSVTKIRSMPFSHHSSPIACPLNTLHVYSVEVTGLSGGLEWPLDVFGMFAVRDSVDRKLNLVFYRLRDNCQTLTEKDPYLKLTGPTRAIVLGVDNDVFVEVKLKVRGNVQSEDKCLSFVADTVPVVPLARGETCYTSKCSSLRLIFGRVWNSVEATVFIRVEEGSWPVGAHGDISALNPDKSDSDFISLLEFGADNVPVSSEGNVELSRQVVCVENGKNLELRFRMFINELVVVKVATFRSNECGRCRATLQIGNCEFEIIVGWSALSTREK